MPTKNTKKNITLPKSQTQKPLTNSLKESSENHYPEYVLYSGSKFKVMYEKNKVYTLQVPDTGYRINVPKADCTPCE